jgi:hypothetical protein
VRHDDAHDGRRRERANPIDDDNRTDREGNAHAQGNDHYVGLGVIAVLERLIPPIEHLHDGPTDSDGDDCRDSQSSCHYAQCNIVNRVLLSFDLELSLINREVPPNDGGVSLGKAALALSATLSA